MKISERNLDAWRVFIMNGGCLNPSYHLLDLARGDKLFPPSSIGNGADSLLISRLHIQEVCQCRVW